MMTSDYYVKLFEELEKAEPNKSSTEIERDNLEKEYRKRFGRGIGYTICGRMPATIEEEIEEIRECLRTGTPQKEEPWDDNNTFIV